MKAVLLFALVGLAMAGTTCTFNLTASDGTIYEYDLSPMQHTDDEFDFLNYYTSDKYKITMNFCGRSGAPCSNPNCSVCMWTTSAYKFKNCGTWTHQKASLYSDPSQGIVITYSEGDACSDSDTTPRASEVTVLCTSDVPGVMHTATTGCTNKITVHSKYGCPIATYKA